MSDAVKEATSPGWEKHDLLEALLIQDGSEFNTFPLSFAQQRLWFLDQLEPGNPIYNIPAALWVKGPLDVAALERSFNRIVERHEALRTRFLTIAGQPVQVILPELTIPLVQIRLDSLPDAAREAEIWRYAIAEARRPFDLASGPHLRVTLLHLADAEHVLLITMHHIVSDGWSMGILIRELTTLYNQLAHGLAQDEAGALPDLPIQYADYAAWQREWLQDDTLAEHLAYWQQQLNPEGTPELPVLALPTDRPRPATQTFAGSRYNLALSPDLTEALRAFSRREGVTLFMTLLAAFQTLLYRYTGQQEILIGSPVANRSQSEIKDLIGCFINTIVLRGDLSGNPPFQDLLRRVRETTLAAYQHEELPFEKLIEALHAERSMSHSPLFQVMFALQSSPLPLLRLRDLTLEPLDIDSGTAKFDLMLNLDEAPDALSGWFEYSHDLFDESTIERMAAQFKILLEGIVAQPHVPVAHLPLLPDSEHELLIRGWNQTEQEFPSQLCLHQLIEAQVERTPGATAVVAGKDQLTYEELNIRANRLAHYLVSLGVGPEVCVGVCIERGADLIVALLAVLKAGGLYLPLDPAYPPERLRFMLDDASAPIVLTQASLITRLPLETTQILCLDTIADTIAEQPSDNPRILSSAGNLAYLIYTSGSTGRPKGVAIEHRSAVALVEWAKTRFSAEDLAGVLAATSVCFDLSIFEIFVPLSVGGTVIVAANALELPNLPAAGSVTLINTVPSAITELLRIGGVPDSVRTVNLAGEPLPQALAQQLYDLPHIRQVVNLYGPSEDTTYSTYAVIEREVPTIPPIGRPIGNTRAYLLDAQMQPVPIGVPGELYLTGAGLARGYLKRPDLTAERFIPDPFSETPGTRLYKTGDLARYLPDGALEFGGRIDHQVKVRGFRIELGEIEAALRQHEAIRDAAVLVRDERLVAYVVENTEHSTASRDAGDDCSVFSVHGSSQELRQHLGSRLPDYMVPSAFVVLDALPLTTTGKIDRTALARIQPQQEPAAEVIAPRTPTEELLAQIWSLVLDVAPIGVEDNFFALGGHSLLATQVVSRIREVFQLPVPLRWLFEEPTIAGLAALIDAARQTPSERQSAPITRIERSGNIPVSFAQRRLWFLDQLQPNSPFYNIPVAARLVGSLNVAALEQSINEIVRRHEVLRATIKPVNGEPVQVIADTLTLSLPIEDLQGYPPGERQAEMSRRALEESQQPFDLARGPLVRARLLRLALDEHVLLLTMHHIVSDAWSMGVFIREVIALYKSFSSEQSRPEASENAEHSATLPPLPIQYADFAVWQRQWLQGEVLGQQIAYWSRQLGDSLPVLDLPTDRPRPPVQTTRGAIETLVLPESLHQDLIRLSYQEGVTLFMTLLAAYQTLLRRYTGLDDIIVGTPIANRNRSDIEDVIGFFVNTLVLRTDLSGNPRFRELLGRVRHIALEAYSHQDLPFEQLVEVLQPKRDPSRTPLFQVMFALQNAPLPVLREADLTLEPIDIDSGAVRFDLSMNMVETPQGLAAKLEHNTDLFDTSTAKRILGHFQTLLEQFVARPNSRIDDVPMLTATEAAQILDEWNQTDQTYPEQCIHHLVEAQLARQPEGIAVLFENTQLTAGDLNRRANQLARYLETLGVGPEVRVGICVERSLDMIVGLLGILKAGGAYVPLDPDYPRDRLAFMAEDACVPVLLTQAHLLDRLPQHGARLVCLDTDWPEIAVQRSDNPTSGVLPDQLAYVIYTSGSSGKPKGTMISHRSVTNFIASILDDFKVTPADRVLQFATFCFDVSVFEIFTALASGATLVLGRRETLLHPPSLTELLQTQRISIMDVPPAIMNLLPGDAFPDLRIAFVGGEAFTGELVNRWTRPGRRFINGYGPTEATVAMTAMDCEGYYEQTPPIGRPMPNHRVYILDSHLMPVPVNIAGELYISGVGLARGYLNRPDLTAEKFIPDPFSQTPGGRLYATGDLVRYLPDGNIEFLGRLDHQVKIRGLRIELGEIESALAQHPGVRESVVVVREDMPGEKRLVAYVVKNLEPRAKNQTAEQGGSRSFVLSSAELHAFLQAELPSYMVPSAFVFLDTLPLGPSGKVDRRALPAPVEQNSDLDRAFAAPRTATEELMAVIWASVLNLEQVSIDASFFDLGGHSLLATQLISRVREAFSVELPLRSLFEEPTVAALSSYVDRMKEAAQGFTIPPLGPAPRDRELPLSFAQQRLWVVDQLEPGSATYNNLHALRLTGQLDVAALEQSLNEIIRRHEVLRTTFASVHGRPIQVIHPSLALKIGLIDLRNIPSEQQMAEVRRLAKAEASRPFDLASGPLLRVTLLQLGADDAVILATIHHIVTDAWSTGIFIRELATLYESFSTGRPSALPELPIQYADFAYWERQWLQGETLERLLAHWKQQLAGAPAKLALPADRPRPAVQTFRGAYHPFELSAELSQQLRALSSQESSTLFTTLLAALNILLQQITGQNDILVGTNVANRNQIATESLIGFFVNTLALRTNLSGNPRFQDLLKQVREVTLRAFAHQNLPFARLIEAMHVKRDLSNTQLVQVVFSLQNTPMPQLELSGTVLRLMDLYNDVARFDLVLFMEDGEQGLKGAWNYNTDLFEPATIARIARYFETLLANIVANPADVVSQLTSFIETERKQQAMEKRERRQSGFKSFSAVKPKAVDLPQEEVIKTSFFGPEATLPLVIQPNIRDADLIDWAQHNREFLESKLLQHGAILFRGFDVKTAAVFEQFAQSITPQLYGEYGDLPREGVGGNVYTSTPYPPDKEILFHNESSHVHRWPMKQWFYCVVPAQQGGETPIVDCRKIYQQLDPAIRAQFAEKGLMYVRNYTDGLDVSWERFFQTSDRAAVEEYCRRAGIDCEWKPGNGLRTRERRLAVARHPKTGETVFFNQIQVHHIACLDPEIRESLYALYGEENLPRNVYYGDGSPIEEDVIHNILDLYHALAVGFTWQAGDILMLDNMLTAHGRYPFVGPRKILVAMGEMISESELQ